VLIAMYLIARNLSTENTLSFVQSIRASEVRHRSVVVVGSQVEGARSGTPSEVSLLALNNGPTTTVALCALLVTGTAQARCEGRT
jgi:hypothetical protein